MIGLSCQRAFAALLAMAARSSAFNFLPVPRHHAYRQHVLWVVFDSSISAVAILVTMMAAPITFAGRFSPFGPRGIYLALSSAFAGQTK
jgi:hypothetical protein